MTSTTKKKKSLIGRIFKWTGITLLLLIVLAIVLPFIFKDKLIQLAKDEANKQLNATVNWGEFDLSLISSFPEFNFKIDDVSVIGVDQFAKDTLAFIKRTELSLDLMSVISGDKYKVREILLDEPRIYGHVLADGKANWDITKPSADTTTSTDTSATKFDVSLKSLRLKDAVIRYNDESSDMTASLHDFDFDMSGDFTQDNFVMDIVSEIQKLNFSMSGVPYARDLHNTMKISMDMNMPAMKFTFKENEIGLNDLLLGIDGYLAMPKDDIEMDMKFNCPQTEFKSILSLIPAVYSKDFASVQTKGKLALNGFAKGIYNDKTMPGFGVHLEIADAMFKYPSLPKSVNNINVKVDVNNPNGNPDATVIDVHRFHVEMAGNPLDAALHVKTPVSDPSLNGEIKGKVDLTSVKEFVPLEKGEELSGVINADVRLNGRMSMIEKEKYDEFKAEGSVEVTGMNYKTASLPSGVTINTMKMLFSPKFVELASFDSKMGRSDIKASGKIEDFMQYFFKDSLLKGQFTLQSSLIDLNEMMGPSETTPTAAANTQAAAAPADTAPLSVIPIPANIDFVLNSNLQKVLYDKLDINNVAGTIIVRNSRLSMENLKMNMLDGALSMKGYYDTKNEAKPEINYNLEITDFDIQKSFNAFNTVQKLAPVGKYSAGKFSASIKDMKSNLDKTMMPDMNSLVAKGNVKMKSVKVEGFEPFNKLADALKNENFKKMEFQNIAAFFEVKNGRMILDPFKTKIKNVDAEISGSTGYDQTIDYRWVMQIPTKDLPSQATNALEGLLGKAGSVTGKETKLPEKVDVTALIGGTVTKPEIKTGMKDVMANVKNEVKEQVKEIIEEKKEEIIKDVKAEATKEIEKILADAQREADRVKEEGAKLAEQTRTEGNKRADELESKGGNPIEKIANKKLAEKLRKETEEKAKKITDESNAKADKIMEDARARADKLKQQ